MFDVKELDFEFGGKQINVTTGRIARQAAGAVEISCGNTKLLVSVSKSAEPRDGIDFFPLLVDYEEKLYSIGKIPGSYNRREGRASDKAILSSRLIDRPVRPLFPEGYRNDVQISVITLSVDMTCPPDVLGMIGAGFALEISGVPFQGPLGSVRVGLNEDDNFIINPSEEEILASDLDLIVSGTKDSVMMVEAGAKFVSEDTVIEAIGCAHEEIQKLVDKIAEFGKLCGVEKEEFVAPEKNQELIDIIAKASHDDIVKSMDNARTKEERAKYFDPAKEKAEEAVAAAIEGRDEDDALVQYLAANSRAIGDELKKYEKKVLRAKILDTKERSDGRKHDEVRPLNIQVGLLPNVHGDGLFTRGQTQVMSIVSFGPDASGRYLDGLDSEEQKFFMHNYNFPAFSVGEVRPNRGPGRRETGHGALAERAVQPSLPSREDFPYTIRIVSEVLESSGSTSMGATCASTLALMNAGVPVSNPVAGVAMGLVLDTNDNYVVLTDIRDLEDFLGDMDFKVAGSEDGITALQMDIKLTGISMDVIRDAIKSARKGRNHILKSMLDVIPEPAADLKENSPRIAQMFVPTDKIGAIIGPSGKHIKWIIEKTGAQISIEDDGKVSVFAPNKEAIAHASELVTMMSSEITPGQTFTGEVVKVLDKVGAIVELFPGQSGLVHISQIDHTRVNEVTDFLNLGDEVEVKVLEVDNYKGRISLSRKALLPEPPESEKKGSSEEASDKKGDSKPKKGSKPKAKV